MEAAVGILKAKFLINSETMEETPLAIPFVESPPSNQLNVSINTGEDRFYGLREMTLVV